MAKTPTKTDESEVELSKFETYVIEKIAKGLTPPEIARKLAPNDREMRKKIRRKVYYMLQKDAVIRKRLQDRARAETLMGLVPAAKGLSKRATRRTDAAKVLFEITDFHNPRVKHEHSGDVKITLDIPRPTFADAVTTVEEGD